MGHMPRTFDYETLVPPPKDAIVARILVHNVLNICAQTLEYDNLHLINHIKVANVIVLIGLRHESLFSNPSSQEKTYL